MPIDDLKESLGINDDDFKGFKDGATALEKSTEKFRKGVKGAKSVVKAAKGNIFEFPVFISSSVPLDYATATTSLLEQVFASYLQMAISANPVISAKSAKNGTQFAHLKSDTNKYLECVDTTYQTDAAFNHIGLGYTMNGDEKFIEFSLISVDDGEARVINEQCDYQPLSEFDHFFTEAKSTRPTYTDDDFRSTTTSSGSSNETSSTKGSEKSQSNERTRSTATRQNTGGGNNAQNRGQNNQDSVTTTLSGTTKEGSGSSESSGSKSATSTNTTTSGLSKAQQDELVDRIYQTRLTSERLENELNAKAELTDANGHSYERQEAEAQLKKIVNDAKKAEHDAKVAAHNSAENILQQEDRIRNLDEQIKKAQRDKAPEELAKLKAERETAEKKLKDYEEDHKNQQAKIKAETDKLNAEIKNMANKYALDLKAAERDAAKEAREAEKYEYEKSNRRGEERDMANRGRVRAAQFMDETKIQKLNTMKPLMMTVDMNVEGKDGRIVQGVEYVVGVKCHNRLVDSSVLPEVVEYPLKEMNKITRKAKWRAGELKFFKDILFKIPQKKQTAIDSRDPKRKWYRRLYELAHIKGDAPAKAIINGDSVVKAFFKDKLGKYGDTNGVIPNVAMVISKSDVDIIKRETKIDMLKGSSAAKFCKELFMIGIVVIDNDAESIKILLPDLHNDYEVHSLGSVNKQLSLLDTSGTKTRDMFKLLG